MRAAVVVWRFLAGDTRSAPAGVALSVLAVVLLERAHVAPWTLPLAFTGVIASALVAALVESVRT